MGVPSKLFNNAEAHGFPRKPSANGIEALIKKAKVKSQFPKKRGTTFNLSQTQICDRPFPGRTPIREEGIIATPW